MEGTPHEANYEEQVNINANAAGHHPPLTISEISSLWQEQMYYSMLRCFSRHFVNHVDDPDTRLQLDHLLGLADARLTVATDIFQREGQSLPQGFTDEDVDVNAPRLFSDQFYLYYIRNLIPIGLSINSLAIARAARADVREFYQQSINSTLLLWKNTANLLLEKGLFIRSPYITTINQKDFVKKQNFLGGFLVERRPLLAVEIDQLFFCILANTIGKALSIGYRQGARSEQVRKYIDRGKEIAEKVIKSCESILRKEDIPIPMHWDVMVTDSTVPTFSDKIMMYHLSILNGIGISSYAIAMASSLRHDLSANYARIIAEVSNYAEDGINIMIENEWYEEPPRAVDRRELVSEPQH